jgi:predicted glutamine amidotransferase
VDGTDMCRLFGLHAGRDPANATFWLLEAPGSLLEQSHRNPDGYGLGTFDANGCPDVDKAPLAAHVAEVFAREAREACSSTFVAHVRYASVGDVTFENSQPFLLDGRLFAHNGIVGDLDRVEAELGDLREALLGTADSERLFALITKRIRDHDGDVRAGIESAVRWLADEVELYSLNFVLTSADELWALRYPEGNELWMLRRTPDDEPLDEHGSHGEITVLMEVLERPVVVVASERMDDDPRWRELQPGELLRVGPDLEVSVDRIVDRPPRHLMELKGRAAESQEQSVSA